MTRSSLLALAAAVFFAAGPVAAQAPGDRTPLPGGLTQGAGPVFAGSRVKDECDQGLTDICKTRIDLTTQAGRNACLKAGGVIQGVGPGALCMKKAAAKTCPPAVGCPGK